MNELPLFGNNSITISDVSYYNEELYVGGLFSSIDSSFGNIYNIAKYNGSDWVSVGGGIRGSFQEVDKMIEYHGKLYVAGVMSKEDGNPGNGLAAWDGTQWDDAGGGVTYGTHLIHIFDMLIFHDRLYVVGDISNAGGVPTYDIASWDGETWCGMGADINTFDNRVLSLGVFRDTLYIGGGFQCVDGDCDIPRIAKLIGPDYVAPCGNSTGINLPANEQGFSIYPNPSNDYFNIKVPPHFKGTMMVYNLIGQQIANYKLTLATPLIQIDLSNFSSGLYLVRIESEAGTMNTLKLIKP